ncbi:hypothetical protein [Desulfospira joergensenii]|uniref:hypothetical protein n=1 Tax=Desulfospira joergensenii TaxID=53329 RepID=UPI0003B4A9BC|nr:hypothetical protein [Desulfospira joergensenii]
MKKNFRPFIIDVEASGFGQLSYPIEIGLAMEPDHRYCKLILPTRKWTHWDRKAEAVHKIPRKVLYRHGSPPKKVAEELNRLLDGSVVYTDGWSVDKPWVTRLFEAAGLRRQFSVSPLERILSEDQMEIWHETQTGIIEKFSLTRHRASTDAFIVQETYVMTLARTA